MDIQIAGIKVIDLADISEFDAYDFNHANTP